MNESTAILLSKTVDKVELIRQIDRLLGEIEEDREDERDFHKNESSTLRAELESARHEHQALCAAVLRMEKERDFYEKECRALRAELESARHELTIAKGMYDMYEWDKIADPKTLDDIDTLLRVKKYEVIKTLHRESDIRLKECKELVEARMIYLGREYTKRKGELK